MRREGSFPTSELAVRSRAIYLPQGTRARRPSQSPGRGCPRGGTGSGDARCAPWGDLHFVAFLGAPCYANFRLLAVGKPLCCVCVWCRAGLLELCVRHRAFDNDGMRAICKEIGAEFVEDNAPATLTEKQLGGQSRDAAALFGDGRMSVVSGRLGIVLEGPNNRYKGPKRKRRNHRYASLVDKPCREPRKTKVGWDSPDPGTMRNHVTRTPPRRINESQRSASVACRMHCEPPMQGAASLPEGTRKPMPMDHGPKDPPKPHACKLSLTPSS